MKKILLVVLSVIFLSGLPLPAQAAPSLESYQEVISSVPGIGDSVRNLPEYIMPIRVGGHIVAFEGTYGELEIHGNVDAYNSGRVIFLDITPVSGEADTSSVASSVADCLISKYGRASTVVPGEVYLWSRGRFQLQYAVKAGIITGNY